jgi:hypothetical protein
MSNTVTVYPNSLQTVSPVRIEVCACCGKRKLVVATEGGNSQFLCASCLEEIIDAYVADGEKSREFEHTHIEG